MSKKKRITLNLKIIFSNATLSIIFWEENSLSTQI